MSKGAPTSTYRLQLRSGLTLGGVRALVDYLDALGVGSLYLSPPFRAASGSSHGYDIVDPTSIDAQVGSLEELEALSEELTNRGMGLILDIVPNHMSTSPTENAWWRDVLREGEHSSFARFFDIDWHPPEHELEGKVLVPVLAESLARAIEEGKLRLVRTEDGLSLGYGAQLFPLSPESVGRHVLETEEVDAEVLERLLDKQAYRLCPWREANERLNYRRFFDINDLVGVRVEDTDVFEATHRLVSSLVDRGIVQGLRVDHIDGLRDPAGYLERFSGRTYVVVEKILEGDEQLRDWPVAGTTGYETLNSIQHLFVDPAGFRGLTLLHRDFTGIQGSFEDAVYEAKKHVLEASFGAEVAWLAEEFAEIAGTTLSNARRATTELVACFPVYRTYVAPGSGVAEDRDREVLDRAISAAKRRNREHGGALFENLASILLRDETRGGELRARFQQLTGPAMAKGVEDTAFYRYYPLVSLNEVGGGSSHLDDLQKFHERNAVRARQSPTGLTATSTHDTKRDEDVRSRIHVLSEDADGWRDAIERWRDANQRYRRALPSHEAPDGSEEYLFYQTLLGSWPLEAMDTSTHLQYVERIQSFMLKAMREAKRNTNWTDPDTLYEAAVLDFVGSVLDRDDNSRFLADFARYEADLRRSGLLNALSQLLLKATVPGVPDFYQGTELFQLSLVDPDNRRPVDFDARRQKLADIDEEIRARGSTAFVADAMNHLWDGRLKLHWTRVLCRLRRERSNFFREAGYWPVGVDGELSEHVIAFVRASGSDALIVAAGRWFQRLDTTAQKTFESWKNTSIRLDGWEATRYREILSDRVLSPSASSDGVVLSLGEVYRHAPLALLETLEE